MNRYLNIKIMLEQAVRLSVLPPVVCQVLLQLCYPVEFVEEPLVYGCQLVDLINTHATVEGLKSRDKKTDWHVTFIFITIKFTIHIPYWSILKADIK